MKQRSISSQKHLRMELRLGPEPGRATGVGARLGWDGLEFGRDGTMTKEMYQNQAVREGHGRDLLSRLGLGIYGTGWMIDGRGVGVD